MRAHLPKDQPRSRAPKTSVPALIPAAHGHGHASVVNQDGSHNTHAAEEAMLNDIGLYRHSTTYTTNTGNTGMHNDCRDNSVNGTVVQCLIIWVIDGNRYVIITASTAFSNG
jgi:hypothetical protein